MRFRVTQHRLPCGCRVNIERSQHTIKWMSFHRGATCAKPHPFVQRVTAQIERAIKSSPGHRAIDMTRYRRDPEG